MGKVDVPEDFINKIAKTLRNVENELKEVKAAIDTEDWIHEKEAYKILGYKSVRTLQNERNSGNMPKSYWREGYKKNIFYSKSKLMGL